MLAGAEEEDDYKGVLHETTILIQGICPNVRPLASVVGFFPMLDFWLQ